MRWLIDENVPKHVVDWLIERGDDVLDVAASPHRSQPDQFLWQLAGRESRVVVTHDLGFMWPSLSPLPPGVVVIRTPDKWRAQQIANAIIAGLQMAGMDGLCGMVTLIEPGRTRQRPLASITR